MKTADKLNAISLTQNRQLLVDGKVVEVPLRVPNAGEYVVIDAINFVMHIDSFSLNEFLRKDVEASELIKKDLMLEQREFLDKILIERIESDIEYIFGEGFNKLVPTGKGIHYYERCYQVKSGAGEILLNVGIGGQNDTVFFGLTGTGCKLACSNWEANLHCFLNDVAADARITRIDLAHDDFFGKYSSFELANQAETDNRFMLRKSRNRPVCRIDGDFKNHDPYNKGLTLYVGQRKNGKVIRCYEKGKQLGDGGSLWFRSELEIHNKTVEIPFDVLLHPTDYFCGAYPYTYDLIQLAKSNNNDDDFTNFTKFHSVKKESEITIYRAVDILRNQFGKYIKVLGEFFTNKNGEKPVPDYFYIFELLKSKKKKDYYPKRLRLAADFMDNPYYAFNGYMRKFEKSYPMFS